MAEMKMVMVSQIDYFPQTCLMGFTRGPKSLARITILSGDEAHISPLPWNPLSSFPILNRHEKGPFER